MKKGLLFWGLLLSVCLTAVACQSTPDSVEKDGAVTVKESIETKESALKDTEPADTDFLEAVPENYKDEWKTENDRLSFDAEVVVPEGKITKGTIEEVLVDENLIRKVLLKEAENEIIETEDDSGRHLIVEDKNHEASSDLGRKYECVFNEEFKRFDFTDFIKEGLYYYSGDSTTVSQLKLTDEEKKIQENRENQVTEILEQLGINKKIESTLLCKEDDGTYETQIRCTTIIDGIPSYPLSYFASDTQTYIDDGCGAQVNDNGIYSMYNTSNYKVSSSEEVKLLSFDTIIAAAKQLFEQQLISNYSYNEETPSNFPVCRIRLTYILKNNDTQKVYLPVWVFEKYADINYGYTPLFIIDAQTGELEFYSSLGF